MNINLNRFRIEFHDRIINAKVENVPLVVQNALQMCALKPFVSFELWIERDGKWPLE